MGSLFLISRTLLPLKGSGKEHTYPSNSRCGGNRAFLSFFFPRFLFHGEYVILFIEGVDLATLHYDRRTYSSSVGAQKRTMYREQSALWPSFPLILGCKLNSCRQCVTVNCAFTSEQSSNYHLRFLDGWILCVFFFFLRINNLNTIHVDIFMISLERWKLWVELFRLDEDTTWKSVLRGKKEWKHEWFL